ASPALRKRGYSKNGRGDAPQIVIGLAVTRDGLPVRSWVFPGNQADVKTVEGVKDDLRGWRLGRCVFVGDSGMNSEENRRRLSLGGGKYILAARMRAGASARRSFPVEGLVDGLDPVDVDEDPERRARADEEAPLRVAGRAAQPRDHGHRVG